MKLTDRQLAVLRAAPISVDCDHGNGDPHRMPRFIYHGVDGRVAASLWRQKLLTYQPVGYGAEGGVLCLTEAARHALLQAPSGEDGRGR